MRKTVKAICMLSLLVFCSSCNNASASEDEAAYRARSLHKGSILTEKLVVGEVKVVNKEDAWMYLLVNGDNPLPEGFTFEKATLSNGMIFNKLAINHLNEMLSDAKKDGVALSVVSAYRTIERQTANFERKIKQYMAQGYNYNDAYNIAKTIVAVPGTSEHHTGLAADIVTPSYLTLDDGFDKTSAYAWLSENCYRYGFILRYPKDKVDITKIIYEPWHYRYVGVDLATKLTSEGITLEEYFEQTKIVVLD